MIPQSDITTAIDNAIERVRATHTLVTPDAVLEDLKSFANGLKDASRMDDLYSYEVNLRAVDELNQIHHGHPVY